MASYKNFFPFQKLFVLKLFIFDKYNPQVKTNLLNYLKILSFIYH